MAPSHWQELRLRDLLVDDTSGFWGEAPEGEGDIAVLRSTNLRNSGRLDLSDIAKRSFPDRKREQKRLEPGDILLERSGGGPAQPVGRVALFEAGGEFSFSNFMQRLRPNSARVLSKFLFYVLWDLHARGETSRLQQATTGIRNLRYDEYLERKHLVPPLAEQRKIAGILSSVDETMETSEAVIAQLDVVKKAVLEELLTRGLPGRHSRFKKTEIGEVPEEWKVATVAEVAPRDRPCAQTGPFGQQLRPCEFVSAGVPVLKIGNVRSGHMCLDALDYVTREKAEALSRFVIREGDLLFARQGATTGRNALADAQCDGAIINYHIIRVAVDRARCDPRFLSNCFNSSLVQKQVGENKKKGNRDGINTKQIIGFRFPLPTIEEQRLIADTIGAIALNAEAIRAEVAHLKNMKEALMSGLLTGEFRVQPGEDVA